MNKHLRHIGVHFELYLGSVFLSITTVLVIMNVFTRYFLRFTFTWSEEIAVGAFIWVIFLGLANAYKTRGLIGVEVLTNLVPEKYKAAVVFVTSLIVSALAITMFVFSYKYVIGSTKITAALEISYKYIYSALIVSFALISIYSLYFLVQSFRNFFLKQDVSITIEDDLEERLIQEEIEMMRERREEANK